MARDHAGYTQEKIKFGLFECVNHLTYTVLSVNEYTPFEK